MKLDFDEHDEGVRRYAERKEVKFKLKGLHIHLDIGLPWFGFWIFAAIVVGTIILSG